MTKRPWKRVLRESMVGPIVLAQFAAGVFTALIRATAEPIRWVCALGLNWLMTRSHTDAIPPFDPDQILWPLIAGELTQALLLTGFLYLLTVWLYADPAEAQIGETALDVPG